MKLTEAKLKELILETMEVLDPEMRTNLLQLLNGDVDDQRMGLDVAEGMADEDEDEDVVVGRSNGDIVWLSELLSQVDAMPQLALFSEPPSAESFLNIIRTRIQEKIENWGLHKGMAAYQTVKQLVADDSPLWATTELDGWASDYHKKTIPAILNDIEYDGDGHDVWIAATAIDVVTKEFDKMDEDLAFDLELKWSFDIMDELYAYFKNYEDMLVSLKAKELSKLIRKTHNEIE